MKTPYHATTEAQLSAVPLSSGGFIFYGRQGMGKLAAACELARTLNCPSPAPDGCSICLQIMAGSFPDLIILEPDEKQSITVEQVRALGQNLALSPYSATGTRLVVIDYGHRLTPQAQNALLKLIEEPPPQTRVLILTERLEPLLPTVRSRLGLIYFAPVAKGDIAEYLEAMYPESTSDIELVVDLAHGAPRVAHELLRNKELRTAEMSHGEQAKLALEGSMFERMSLAKRLSEAKENLEWLPEALEELVTHNITSEKESPAVGARQLSAIERYRKQLRANVGARAATERLVLEL